MAGRYEAEKTGVHCYKSIPAKHTCLREKAVLVNVIGAGRSSFTMHRALALLLVIGIVVSVNSAAFNETSSGQGEQSSTASLQAYRSGPRDNRPAGKQPKQAAHTTFVQPMCLFALLWSPLDPAIALHATVNSIHHCCLDAALPGALSKLRVQIGLNHHLIADSANCCCQASRHMQSYGPEQQNSTAVCISHLCAAFAPCCSV